MKRLITFFFVLLTLLWALPAIAQRANPNTITRIRGASTNLANIAAVRALTLTYPVTTYGLHTNASTYYYDGANWRWWAGAQLNVDDIPVTTYVPRVGNFNHIYDMTQGQNNWDRMVGLDITLEPKDFLALLVYSANMFWDITNGYFDDWEGDALDNDAVPVTQRAPFVGNFNHIYQTDGDVWARDAGETADGGAIAITRNAAYRFSLSYVFDGTDWAPTGADAQGDLTVNQTTTTPGYGRLQDGDSTVLADVIDTHGDDLALTLNGLNTAAFMYGYDGTTMDLLRLGASDELQVTDVATRPGEDSGNDWRKVKKEETAAVTPIKETTATIGTATVTCFASREIINDPNWCYYIKNTDGADPIVDVDIEVSANNADWIDLGWAACDGLAAGVSCVYCISGNAYRYVRGRCTATDANAASSETHYTGNKN